MATVSQLPGEVAEQLTADARCEGMRVEQRERRRVEAAGLPVAATQAEDDANAEMLTGVVLGEVAHLSDGGAPRSALLGLKRSPEAPDRAVMQAHLPAHPALAAT